MLWPPLRPSPAVCAYPPVSLIRPLGYLEERQIIACAGELGILKAACTCPYGLHSQRREVRRNLAEFTGGSGAVKRRILKALSSGAADLLEDAPVSNPRTQGTLSPIVKQ